MIEIVKEEAYRLLENDNSGHGKDHIERVLNLSLKFAESEEADLQIVALASLLHDVDDYKLFGDENAEELSNAKRILDIAKVDEDTKQKVITIIKTMGYSKLLKGVRPKTIEGQIVSDADMCDAIGANGILRVYAYDVKAGAPFFDKNIWPIEDVTADKYMKKEADSSVCHIFEKILKLKNLMMTEAGKKEAIKRHDIVVQFLYNLFSEENAQDWIEYLDKYNQKIVNHNMKLDAKVFEMIDDGIIRIEYRLKDEKRKLLRIGDTITFSKLPDQTEQLKVKITNLKTYNTLLEMYSDTFDLYLKDYYSTAQEVVDDTPYYSEEEIQKYGCLAIYFEKI